MFPLHMPKVNTRRVLLLSLIASIVLTSCPPQIPIKITDVSTSSSPIVGKFVDLYVELTSRTDEPNVLVFINFPPPIYSEDHEHRWELSFKEGEPVTISTEMCVIEAGMWAIGVSISIYSEDGLNMGGDRTTIGLTSKADSGEVLFERDIRFDQQKMTEEAHEFDIKNRAIRLYI